MSSRICKAVVALTLTGSFPLAAAAQDLFGPRDRAALARFRPSLDGLTRCGNAVKALGAAAAKDPRLKAEIAKAEAESNQDTSDATLEQDIGNIEKTAPAAVAFMVRTGCPIRDYYLNLFQFVLVQMIGTPLAKEAEFLPPETVAFWRKNAAAAERLMSEAEKGFNIGKQ